MRKEITLASHSGFCYGVKRAIDKAEEAASEAKKSGVKYPIHTKGPLIHNKLVIEDLKAQGVSVIESLSEAQDGAVVIVRAHGETEAFFQEAEQRKVTVIDATCPHVSRIQKLARDASDEGCNVVIVGDENHPEVIGIRGWCKGKTFVASSREDVEKIEDGKLYVVSQTTITEEMFGEVTSVIKKKFKDVQVKNTICSATSKRQESCRKLAQCSDLMLIIGGNNSSNSKKLYGISKKNCENTYFIELISDLPLKEIEKCNKIGVAAGASTPERIIKEVIATMSEVITENKDLEQQGQAEEVNGMEAMMEEIEKSLKLPARGEIVEGEVVQTTERYVVVNLGCKKDGILPKDELTLKDDETLPGLFKEGDKVQAKVIKTDDGDGNILLSKKKLEVNEHWDEINEALDNKSVVNAKVVKEVKGGVIAVYKEVSGFIPMSQLSDRYVEKADEFIGKVLPVKVSRVDQRRNKAVFSHKAFLAEEKQKKIAEIWESLSIGDVVEGTVMRFTDYGAFVDIGGLDGLLHISEISWGKLKHPQEALEIGQKVHVRILSMNSEKGKISLGLKQNTPEPWSVIDEKYVVGQDIQGKVVQIKDYGAFVELEPGLDGLVHISEVAYKRVTNIADEVSVGQVVSAKILEIDKDRKRISLSIKDTLESPIFDDAEAAAEAEEVAAADEPAEAPVVEEAAVEAVAEEAPAVETEEAEAAQEEEEANE